MSVEARKIFQKHGIRIENSRIYFISRKMQKAY